MTEVPSPDPAATIQPAQNAEPVEEEIVEVRSRPLTDEERFYHEQAYKEPVASAARIEEAAKFLIGAVATTSGLFLTASELTNEAKDGLLWIVPFVLWSASILALVLVLVPQRYETGRNEPASWKAAFVRAHRYKYQRLMIGAVLFVLGVLTGVLPLIG